MDLACSTDSVYAHLGGSTAEPRGLRPTLSPAVGSQPRHCAAYGVLLEETGVALRASWLIDPSGRVRWLSVHDPNTGRSILEILRVLDALQTQKPCPATGVPGTHR